MKQKSAYNKNREGCCTKTMLEGNVHFNCDSEHGLAELYTARLVVVPQQAVHWRHWARRRSTQRQAATDPARGGAACGGGGEKAALAIPALQALEEEAEVEAEDYRFTAEYEAVPMLKPGSQPGSLIFLTANPHAP